MASVSRSKAGLYLVQFFDPGGTRRAIYLGSATKRWAETVKVHVAHLASAAMTHQAPPDETSKWVAALPDKLKRRLAVVGLIDDPGPARYHETVDFVSGSAGECS